MIMEPCPGCSMRQKPGCGPQCPCIRAKKFDEVLIAEAKARAEAEKNGEGSA